MPYNPVTADCYPDSTVLINKLDIRDEQTLQYAETFYTTQRIMELENGLKFENVDLKFYTEIHKYIFQDLYSWAGEFRTINISKKGTSFCPYESLYEIGEAIFDGLKQNNFYIDLPKNELAICVADMFDKINMLHPFREGNGRAEKAFTLALLKNAGYEIDFHNCDKDFLTIATIYSAQGIKEHLINFFKDNIVPVRQNTIQHNHSKQYSFDELKDIAHKSYIAQKGGSSSNHILDNNYDKSIR